MSYTKEFKEAVVRSLLSGECANQDEAAAKYEVSTATIKRWIKQLQPADTVSLPAPTVSSTKPPLPRGWTLVRGIEAVGVRNALGAESKEFGEYCRKNGIMTTDVDAIDVWVKENDVVSAKKHREALQSEVARKDKALAQMSTMIALKKLRNGYLTNTEATTSGVPFHHLPMTHTFNNGAQRAPL